MIQAMTSARPFSTLGAAAQAGLLVCAVNLARAADQPVELVATGSDSRVDLRWSAAPDASGYVVERAPAAGGPYVRLRLETHGLPLHSDFLGENGRTCWYRVAATRADGSRSACCAPVAGSTAALDDERLLDSVEQATFRYFWDYAHPVSGLARHKFPDNQRCAIGGTGFGLLTIMVGAQRGFVARAAAARRVLTEVAFLQDKAQRFHGAFPHLLDGADGTVRPFTPHDDGGDLVETALLMQGLLTVARYFAADDAVEAEIRRRIATLWREVEWDWYLKGEGGRRLSWHWSPHYGWEMGLPITGYNEALIAYVLAIASPTHPIPAACYREGWAIGQGYQGGDASSHPGWIGPPGGGALFMTQYSFLALDPRGRRDAFCDYAENGRAISLMQQAYCIRNPHGHAGYSALLWGLTASTGPDGYHVGSIGDDDGTIAPTAALSAMPFTPRESLATLKHLYHAYGRDIWGDLGFRDAFNPTRGWYGQGYLAIDQGPIVPMLENARSGLCWRMFMSNPEIAPALAACGWVSSATP